MRTLTVISVLIVLLCPTTALHAQDDGNHPPDVVEYIVTGDNANLRAGPGTEFEVVATVAQGTSVFVYSEDTPSGEWVRLYQGAGLPDAYIAAFLLELAPPRYYPVAQQPDLTISGTGSTQSVPYQFSSQAYRLDIAFAGRSLELETIAISGDCDTQQLLDIQTPRGDSQSVSVYLVTGGCNWVFEISDTNRSWIIEFRNILASEIHDQTIIDVVPDTVVRGISTQFTTPLRFSAGQWQLTAQVQDQSFILYSVPFSGDCGLPRMVFNDLVFNAASLTLLQTFVVGDAGCVVYWQTDNVDTEWVLSFAPIN